MSCGLKSEWSDKLFSSSVTPMEIFALRWKASNGSDGKLLLTSQLVPTRELVVLCAPPFPHLGIDKISRAFATQRVDYISGSHHLHANESGSRIGADMWRTYCVG